MAAGALDEVAEPDALSGAAIGALVGGAVAVAVLAGAAALQRDNVVLAVVLLAGLPATTGLGAGVGAVAGWWNSPSGRAMARG